VRLVDEGVRSLMIERSARNIAYWALWDNYPHGTKNAILDALIEEAIESLRRKLWEIIARTDGRIDPDDLILTLERAGWDCPPDLYEEDE
jgi:hypothetical protein